MNDFEKLIKAVRKGDFQKVSEIIENSDVNINQIDKKSGKSLLQIAIQNRDQSVFNVLIKSKKINVQVQSLDGQYPLQTAIMINQPFFVAKILQQNINPRKKNSNGETALQIAVKNQTSQQILNKLLVYNFDINQKVNKYGNLINLAIYHKNLQNFCILINNPIIKIGVKDENNSTCLILAVKSKIGEMVKIILQKIAQEFSDMEKQFFINSQNNDGDTALHIAYQIDNKTMIQIIQKYGELFGLDKNLKNRKCMTIGDIILKNIKSKENQKIIEEKKRNQKHLKNKEKEEEKIRKRIQEQKQKIQQRRIKKQQQKKVIEQNQKHKKQTNLKRIWIMGILFILIIGIMYLVILNAIEKKKNIINNI